MSSPKPDASSIDTRPSMTLLDAAGLCAEHNLFVIPVWRAVNGRCPCPGGAQCKSPGKHPAIDSWQTAASTDLTTLRDWFAAPSSYNIGVVCGLSNIVVIDIDPRNGGQATFEALVSEFGTLPETVTADSGGGGAHYVFRRPLGDLESKLGKGVDLLRDARQFLVEPSLHPSGGGYRWRIGHAPDDIAIATLPESWIKRIRRQARRQTSSTPQISTDARMDRARKYLAKLPPAVSGDSGHTQMFNAVCIAMFGFDLDIGSTTSVINEYNERCDPPFDDGELAHKLRSAAEHCKRERGYLLNANRAPVVTTQQAEHATSRETGGSGTSTHNTGASAHSNSDWAGELIAKKDGTPKKLYHNTEVFVRAFPEYAGKWSLNTMTGAPWFDGEPMRESFVHVIRARIEQRLGFTPTVADIKAAIIGAAEARSFHPVRQYLDSIDWDGNPRLEGVAGAILGAELPLHAQMVRRWMIGAVARAMRPGCKFDNALMLHGQQGSGKSTFFSILGAPWHSDSTIDINNKDAYQQIHAAWLYEFSELENVVAGRTESRIKAFITSTHDSFRAPYAATVTSHARSVALCGTTNRHEILTDDTGSRRYWIVPVSVELDKDLLTRLRDQLWAEARAAYEASKPWWFDRQLECEREEANEDFGTDDSWVPRIREYLDPPSRSCTTIGQVLEEALKIEPGRQDRSAQMRASRVLKRLGWARHRAPTGDRHWYYVRPGSQLGFA